MEFVALSATTTSPCYSRHMGVQHDRATAVEACIGQVKRSPRKARGIRASGLRGIPGG
jgi:hypothetical protein